MKNKLFKVFGFTVIMAIFLIGCTDPSDPKNGGDTSTFKAVTDITGIPLLKQTDTPLTLSGTVVPSDATNKTIVWSIATDDNGSTNPSLEGNVLTTETEGTVKVLATITNGLTASTPYTKTFTINVTDDEITGCGCCVDCEDECDGDCCANCDCGSTGGCDNPDCDCVDCDCDTCDCDDDTEPTPTISDVNVSPDTVSVALGAVQHFIATVSGTNLEDEHKTVDWSIETAGTAEGTVIIDGELTIDATESKTSIVIRATSTFNNAKFGEATVTIFDPAEALKGKWFASSEDANNQGGKTARYEFTNDLRFILNGGDPDDYTYTVEGNEITLTYQITLHTTAKFYIWESMLIIEDSSDTPFVNGTYFKGGQATINANSDPDFTTGTITQFNVGDARQWNASRDYIRTGGIDKQYIININANIEIQGSDYYPQGQNTFNVPVTEGTPSPTLGGKIAIRGNGNQTLSLSDNYGEKGNILLVGAYQTIINRGVILKGVNSNDEALVYISGDGHFILESGAITDNRNTETDITYSGGGVHIRSGGSFIMNSGTISGNYTGANGGGVFVNSNAGFTMNGGTIINNEALGNGGGVFIGQYQTFNMNGGEIKGNTATDGGGVFNHAEGYFNISTGKIYGTDVGAPDWNFATTGASLNGTAVIGTLNGTFTPNGDTIDTTDDTIIVVNGKMIYSDIGNPPAYLLENIWYTSQDNANRRIGDTIEFLDDGRILETDEYKGLTYSVNGTTLTIKKATQQETRTISFTPAIFTLTLTGSGTLLENEYFIPDPDYVPTFDITTAIEWANALSFASGQKGKLNFNIMNDIPDIAGTTTIILAATGETLEITIKGIDELRTLTLISNGSFFTSGARVTITLEENLILQGKTANNQPLVLIASNSYLIMNEGVKITGNSSGGVALWGTLTMNGGEISNAASGVLLHSGSFIMNNGTISGSTNSGVYITENTTFEMNGGTISNNSSRSGGGVYIGSNGTFTMNNGIISNNRGNVSANALGGGGVYIDSNGNFIMINGNIFNNTATDGSNGQGGGVNSQGNFIMKGGTISGNSSSNSGGGVNISSGVFRLSNGTIYGHEETLDASLRNVAAFGTTWTGFGSSLRNIGTATYGTEASDGTDGGNLTTRDTTIKVVNGVLQE